MKHIRQKHKYTCAIAALAMITNIPYDKVYKQIFPKRKTFGRSVPTIFVKTVEFLKKLKIKHKIIFGRKIDFRRLKSPAFVSVQIKSKCYHAVVWDPESKRILDPQPNKKPRINVKYANDHQRYYIKILK